jgi:CHAT domain-containing protein
MQGRTAAYRCKAAVLVLLVLAGSCASEPPEKVYGRLWSMYVAGSLPKTLQAVSKEDARWKKRPNTIWYWQFHLLHAEVLLGQGKTKEAASLLKNEVPALPALEQAALRREVDLANVYLGADRQQANLLLDHAAAGVTDPDLQIRIQLMRGGSWLNTKLDRAEAEFTGALRNAILSGNAYREAQALNNLSLCARRRIQYEKAIDLATQAAEKAVRSHARMVEAQAHNNLANYNLYLGNVTAGSEHLRQAIHLFEAVDARSDLMVGENLLGVVHDVQEDSGGASQSYQQAYRIAMELDRKADAAMYAANVSIALIKNKDWSHAATWNRTAFDLDRQSDGNPNAAIIARNQARIAAKQGNDEEAVRNCRALLVDSQKNPFLRWEAYEMLAGIDTRARRFAQANEEYAEAISVIDGARATLENLQNRITLLSRLIPFYKEYVNSLVEQDNDPKALTVIESGRARVLSEALRRTTEPMVFDAAALKHLAETTKSSIISFWLAPDRSFAWLITPREVRRFVLPPDSEIESMIAAYRNSVEHSWGDPLAAKDAAGSKLWNALLGEIAPRIAHGSNVMIIPDGALHRLNLETLPVPGPSPHYWIEDVNLAVAPSMTLVAAGARPQPAGAPSLLLMGAPVPVPQFDKLPQAEAEIAAIQSHFPEASKAVFTGATATVAAYRQVGPGRFTFLHFAAHAEPNPESPLESSIVLSPVDGQYRLTARDIVGSQLTAGLVTISACRSAGSRVYAGEGLIGLAWAFLEAGSNAVIAGLWDVNDGSSRLLMDQLYAGIAAGKRPAAALHDAKIAMLQGDPRFRKPYFWAPFQVYVRSGPWGQ